jgi:integrase/recombinase XerD
LKRLALDKAIERGTTSINTSSTDVYAPNGLVRPELIIRKGNTKRKLATRTIPVFEDLRSLLTSYQPPSHSLYLFPGLDGHNHMNVDSAARVFKKACFRVGIYGASTHSLRRTALTQMSNAGIPLRIVQEVSGHRNLSQLQKYLEVKPEQVRGAIASLAMISPMGKSIPTAGETDGKVELPDRGYAKNHLLRALKST